MFAPRQAILRAEAKKVAKHEAACLENQHVFLPFAFDQGRLKPKRNEARALGPQIYRAAIFYFETLNWAV